MHLATTNAITKATQGQFLIQTVSYSMRYDKKFSQLTPTQSLGLMEISCPPPLPPKSEIPSFCHWSQKDADQSQLIPSPNPTCIWWPHSPPRRRWHPPSCTHTIGPPRSITLQNHQNHPTHYTWRPVQITLRPHLNTTPTPQISRPSHTTHTPTTKNRPKPRPFTTHESTTIQK